MSSEVTDLIAALRAGNISLDEVARRFRERSWPETVSPGSRSDSDVGNALDDPEPYVPGSFDDVAAAFHRHDLTLEEYGVLAQAAAESINAADQPEHSSPATGDKPDSKQNG
ncbi:MAG TPA: hypothetical protein VEL03_15115 [Streptosporangiaceae bacterium]|nr:hypothetical protein [Streptosporangiaceae bacterium]